MASAFEQAQIDSKKLTEKPSNDELLRLYALYKVGNAEDFAAAPKPGMFDLKGKAKYAAWKKVVDEGLTADEAKEKYVAFVEELKVTYKFDASKEVEVVGGGS